MRSKALTPVPSPEKPKSQGDPYAGAVADPQFFIFPCQNCKMSALTPSDKIVHLRSNTWKALVQKSRPSPPRPYRTPGQTCRATK